MKNDLKENEGYGRDSLDSLQKAKHGNFRVLKTSHDNNVRMLMKQNL